MPGIDIRIFNNFQVYVDELSAEDYLSICQSRHPIIPEELLLKLISFNRRLYEDTMISRIYGQEGSPWEFNLRDVIRSCQIIEGAAILFSIRLPSFPFLLFVQLIFMVDLWFSRFQIAMSTCLSVYFLSI